MSSNDDELRHLIKQLIIGYSGAQHNSKPIRPSIIAAQNGWTAGDNNCYHSSLGLAFGKASKTTGNTSSRFWITLPDNYVDGEDVTIIFWIICPNTDDPNIIDYKLSENYAIDGSGPTNIATPDATWSIADNYIYNKESLTIDGTDLTAGMILAFRFWLEDDNNSVTTIVNDIYIICPLNTRD